MTTLNTTPEKQQNLINFAKELGITLDSLKKMYNDPKKASVLNIVAEGL